MRILITGAGGFVGRHTANELTAHGHEPIGLDIGKAPPELAPDHFITADITDAKAIHKAIETTAPDACIHLAALSFVPSGVASPRTMLDVNLNGTINILEAFRLAAPTARLLFVSTAQVYGLTARPTPIREDDPLRPVSLYAVAKAAADTTALLYARDYGLDIRTARPHNHIGPNQSPQFAVPAFARQVKAIRNGAAPLMKVGNLDNRRDFTDVRDVAVAYRLLIEKGHSGAAYNIASGHEVRMGDILDQLCELAGVHPEIVTDPTLFRPTDQAPVLDCSRLRADTGWTPGLPLARTLADILANS